jgi:hypothetical protein
MGTALVRRCDIFINVFEKYVTERQQQINNMREMESLYNIVSSVVNKWTIDNDVKVSLVDNYITINIVGKPTDSTMMLIRLAQSLQDKFVEHKLKTPQSFDGDGLQTSFYWSFIYKANSENKFRSVSLQYSVPEEGTANTVWKKEIKSYSYEDKTLVLRNSISDVYYHAS